MNEARSIRSYVYPHRIVHRQRTVFEHPPESLHAQITHDQQDSLSKHSLAFCRICLHLLVRAIGRDLLLSSRRRSTTILHPTSWGCLISNVGCGLSHAARIAELDFLVLLDQCAAATAAGEKAILGTGSLDSVSLAHLTTLDALQDPLKANICEGTEDQAL